MSFLIETIPDVSHGHKHLKGIILIYLSLSRPNFSFKLLHSLPSVRGEGQLLLVAPQHIGLLQTGLGQHVMQIHNLQDKKSENYIRIFLYQEQHRSFNICKLQNVSKPG